MAAADTKPSVSEIGYVSGVPSWGHFGGYGSDDGEETPALMYPESVATYGLMRVNGTVHTVMAAVTHPIRRPGVFALDPQGADPAKVSKLSQDIDLPILGSDPTPPARRRGRFSWNEHVRLALLEMFYGHMGFELLVDADALKTTGEARLRKLAPRFPASIADIKVARDGGLESITQHRVDNQPSKPIPVANLLWYVVEREGAAWQGRSPLRPCYGDWLLLDRFLRMRAYLMERQGMGVPIGTAPQGAEQDVIDRMGTLAQQSRGGDSAGVGLPYGASIHFEGVRGTLPDINAAIADHRAALADSVGASFLRLGTAESSGNRALGQTFVDQFTQAQDSRAGHIADTATQHCVEKLWDWNYGTDEPAPAIVSRPIDAETDIDPDQLVALIAAGAITVDESIEDFLRSKHRLPKRTGPRPAEAGPLAPVAAGRRPGAPASPVAAASAATWAERVASALAGAVDAEAIATAVLDGTEPAAAVAAGLDPDDTAALTAVLVAMWGESYGAGQAKANQVAAARNSGQRRPGAPVMASLSGLVSRAREIAAGILSSLFDRLTGALGSADAPATADALADRLAELAGDEAAAERVAVTEAHRSEIAGAVDTWAGMGIAETRWIQNTSEDDVCALRNGTTSAAWDGLPPLHPLCLCELEPA